MLRYKFNKEYDRYIPKGSCIKKQLEEFLHFVSQEKNIFVGNYRGEKPAQEPPSRLVADMSVDEWVRSVIIEPHIAIYNAVITLPIFYPHTECVESNQSHFHDDNVEYRMLTLSESLCNVRGAVIFYIDHQNKICTIDRLGVDSKSQGNGYGEILLHAAILTGVLYGCSRFSLFSLREAIGFYINQGFFINTDCHALKDPSHRYATDANFIYNQYGAPDLVLDFTCELSLEKISNRMRNINPNFNIKNLLSVIKNKIETNDFEEKATGLFFSSDIEISSPLGKRKATSAASPSPTKRSKIF